MESRFESIESNATLPIICNKKNRTAPEIMRAVALLLPLLLAGSSEAAGTVVCDRTRTVTGLGDRRADAHQCFCVSIIPKWFD